MTELLRKLQTGDRNAMELVIPMVYEELKKLARSHVRREARPAPLEATALVHEAFLKMAGGRHPYYENRAHFYGVASRLMRQVLVDTARARASGGKRLGAGIGTSEAAHLMSRRKEFTNDGRADESCSTSNKNTHIFFS